MMRMARSAALRAPLMATVATGIPFGIWTMASSESRPCRLAKAMGTPMTGQRGGGGHHPGQVGGPAGGGDDHLDAAARPPPRAKATVSSGVRWADRTRISTGTSKERRIWTASSMTDESEELPMRMATDMVGILPDPGAGFTSTASLSGATSAGPTPVRWAPPTVHPVRTGPGDRGVDARRREIEAPMRIGVMFDTEKPFDDVVAQVAGLAESGIETAWASQIFAYDALTTHGRRGPRGARRSSFGTAVVPTYPRHPVMLAAQALTVQAASGGRLTLGIGLSHQMVIENVFGMSFDKPARHMREYLEILMPLLAGEQVTFVGETMSASTFGPLQIDRARPRRPGGRARYGHAADRRPARVGHRHVDDRTQPPSSSTSCPPSVRPPPTPVDPCPRSASDCRCA